LKRLPNSLLAAVPFNPYKAVLKCEGSIEKHCVTGFSFDSFAQTSFDFCKEYMYTGCCERNGSSPTLVVSQNKCCKDRFF
jgi:hypothetical protein